MKKRVNKSVAFFIIIIFIFSTCFNTFCIAYDESENETIEEEESEIIEESETNEERSEIIEEKEENELEEDHEENDKYSKEDENIKEDDKTNSENEDNQIIEEEKIQGNDANNKKIVLEEGIYTISCALDNTKMIEAENFRK